MSVQPLSLSLPHFLSHFLQFFLVLKDIVVCNKIAILLLLDERFVHWSVMRVIITNSTWTIV